MQPTVAPTGHVYTLELRSTPDSVYRKEAQFASFDAALDSAFMTLSVDFTPKKDWRDSWRQTDSDSGPEWVALACREEQVARAPHKYYVITTPTSTESVFKLADARAALGQLQDGSFQFSVLERGCGDLGPEPRTALSAPLGHLCLRLRLMAAGLPTDVWRLIKGNLLEREADGYLSLPSAMNMLTLCYALEGSKEMREVPGLRASTQADWLDAAASLRVRGEAAAKQTKEWYREIHDIGRYFSWSSGWRRDDVWWPDDVFHAVEYYCKGVTGRFYWCVGMSQPENMGCYYDRSGDYRAIAKRCFRDLMDTGATCEAERYRDFFTEQSGSLHPDEVEAVDDRRWYWQKYDARAFTLNQMGDYVSEKIESEYQLDLGKRSYEMRAHELVTGFRKSTHGFKGPCAAPRCFLCAPLRAQVKPASHDRIESVEVV